MFVLDFRYMICDTDSVVYPQTCHVLGVPVTNIYGGWSLTCMWGGHLHVCGVPEMTVSDFYTNVKSFHIGNPKHRSAKSH